jgi:hypothetical protein
MGESMRAIRFTPRLIRPLLTALAIFARGGEDHGEKSPPSTLRPGWSRRPRASDYEVRVKYHAWSAGSGGGNSETTITTSEVVLMSKTALTALLIVAGVVIVALVGMMTMGGGMMGGMMGGPGGMMMCPM